MKFYIAVQLLCFTDFIAKHIDLSKWDKEEGKATTPIALNLQLCLRNCVCDGKVCDCALVKFVCATRHTVIAVKFVKSSDQIIAVAIDALRNVCW